MDTPGPLRHDHTPLLISGRQILFVRSLRYHHHTHPISNMASVPFVSEEFPSDLWLEVIARSRPPDILSLMQVGIVWIRCQTIQDDTDLGRYSGIFNFQRPYFRPQSLGQNPPTGLCSRFALPSILPNQLHVNERVTTRCARPLSLAQEDIQERHPGFGRVLRVH